MEKINLYDFYNHTKAKQNSNEGIKIINNTDFKKYKNDKINTSKNYNINDIIIMNDRIFDAVIIDIQEGDLLLRPVNKTTKKHLKKYNDFWCNPLHI